ncbi:MAG: translation initiation factor IF-2 [Oscillospiraceae bacterium]|jgi:translation initiation factor IF-2|nr:translation initiation factor IF-2 [Oscillospiraceae bacterium]
MEIKTKISDLAKDFGMQNKDIVTLLKENSSSGKKYTSTTTIDGGDMSLVFDLLTKKNEVESFDEYFAKARPLAYSEVKAEESIPAAPKAEEKPTPAPVAPKQPKPQSGGAAVLGTLPQRSVQSNQQRSNAKPTAPQRPQQSQQRQPGRQFNNPNQGQQVRSANAAKPTAGGKPAATNRPAPPRHNKPQSAVVVGQNVNRGADAPKTRIVDTRTTHVNVDKYNAKYDEMAASKSGKQAENTQSKQKLNQKSQQYRKNSRRGSYGVKRETEAERLKRIKLEREKKQLVITVPPEITVGDFAYKLKATAPEVIKVLFMMGVVASINETIDYDTAYLAASEFNCKVEPEVIVTIEERIIDDSEDEEGNLVPRSPVVVVMGHVDHGKTSILDAIRTTAITETEAGGITQHIGAYRVRVGDGEITFLDTPGHEAFTTMRARGAQITDIAVLVVAADDGIMPQTIEAINHAKAAGVSIIVAINKMDKEAANPEQIKQQLTEYELVPEEWGGDVICVPVSAKTQEGIPELLESILLVADVKELKANPDRAAKGTVIEARLDKGRGPVATMLVQNGTLRAGDIVVAGTAVGKVRAMTSYSGEKLLSAGPSVPVEITGLSEVPMGGDVFNAVSDERLARELVEQRRNDAKEELYQQQAKITLENIFDKMQYGDIKELKIIVKGDVVGSVEAVRQSLLKLSNEEIRVNIIHGAVGPVKESDIMLAEASNAIIVGFNVRPDPAAADHAATRGVDIRLYRIIYDCIEEISDAMKGMLDPKTRVIDLGRAEVRQVFKITGAGTIAGCYVVSGKIQRNALIRVVRDGIVIAEDKIDSLKRFKDDVKEVAQNYECGIGLEKFGDIKEGDFLENFIIEEYRD